MRSRSLTSLEARALIHFAGEILSSRALDVLTAMRDHADEDDGELVQEGREVWIGQQRTSPRIVLALLRACAIKDDSDNGRDSFRRYVINETGLAILARRRP